MKSECFDNFDKWQQFLVGCMGVEKREALNSAMDEFEQYLGSLPARERIAAIKKLVKFTGDNALVLQGLGMYPMGTQKYEHIGDGAQETPQNNLRWTSRG